MAVALLNVGKYNMNVIQYAKLQELHQLEEEILDSWSPEQFRRIQGFGIKYELYVKRLRGITDSAVKDLLAGDGEAWEDAVSAYVRRPDSFHSLEDGTVDVCVTLNLNPTAAGYLQEFLRRLPINFPKDVKKHTLGWVIKPMVMDAVKNDGAARSSGGAGDGTMSAVDFANLKGGR